MYRFIQAHKTLLFSIGFLAIFSFAVSYAAPMYSPGQTLDPQCAPGSVDCTVAIDSSPWVRGAGGIISYTGGNVGIGTSNPTHLLDLSNAYINANGTAGFTSLTLGGSSSQFLKGDGSAVALNSGDVTGALGYTPFNWTAAAFAPGSVLFTDSSGMPMVDNAGFGYNDTNNTLSLISPNNTALIATNSNKTYGAVITGRDNANGIANVAGLAVFNNAATNGRVSGISIGFTGLSAYSATVGAALVDVATGQADLVLGASNGGATPLERLRIVGATGNVGIGNTAPTGLLTLSGNRTAVAWGTNGPALQISAAVYTDSSTAASTTVTNAMANTIGAPAYVASNTGVTYTNAATLYIAGAPTASTNVTITNPLALYVASGNSYFVGNVGFGAAANPSYKIDVRGGSLRVASGTGASFAGRNDSILFNRTDLLTSYTNKITNSMSGTVGGNTMNFEVSDGTGTGTTAVMTLVGNGNVTVGNGNVGIGSTTPVALLHVNGASGTGIVVSTTASTVNSGTGIEFQYGNGSATSNHVARILPNTESGGGGDLFFQTAATANSAYATQMTLLRNGSVGIGTTTPSVLLHVGNSTVSGVVARFQDSAGSCDINPVTSSLTCSSDMRLKKNVTNIGNNSTWSFNANISFNNQDALSKILALNPVSYNWNIEADNNAKHTGFIAQEIQEVFPDLVTTDPDSGFLSLNYTGLLPYTISAIQEMNLNVTSINDLTKTNTWRDSLLAWFGDTTNGIGDFVANRFRAKDEICINDTCINEVQLQQILQNDTVQQNNAFTTFSESSDDYSSDQEGSQTPEVTEPIVTPPTENSGPAGDADQANSASAPHESE